MTEKRNELIKLFPRDLKIENSSETTKKMMNKISEAPTMRDFVLASVFFVHAKLFL